LLKLPLCLCQVGGASVAILGRYVPQNIAGWVLTTVGMGLLSMLQYDSPKSQWVGYQILPGIGMGLLYGTNTFPVLAALPISETAHALALFTFFETFAQVRFIE